MSEGTFNRLADANNSGSPLRNEAAGYLHAIYGNADIEVRIGGKKVDIVVSMRDFGRTVRLLTEVKDYAQRLTRQDVAVITADYQGLIGQEAGARLLIVTRNGLSTDAESLIEEHNWLRHQTIWELEDEVLGLAEYVHDQAQAFDRDGLSQYYVSARAKEAVYADGEKRSTAEGAVDLFDEVQRWNAETRPAPLAILGGYGAGKTSFSRRIIADQARKALADPTARRPVLIKLGNVTRTAGLDGLLGSLFTNEYEVRGYSYRRFLDLNEKGRLLIVLDGFDEMKHAMSWTDFRNEIEQLNTLNRGDSRVILLGRPSAFTSDDEHLEVLRGRMRSGLGLRKLPDWPEFREYDLEPFTPGERASFVQRYLTYAEHQRAGKVGESSDEEGVTRRVAEVDAIADRDPEVFGKPVHAKILVELALDPSVDLSALASNVTRWSLYSEFFSSLARRETSKAARAPIDEAARLKFLRDVAVWLWRSRDGATSFKASDLPPEMIVALPEGDADTLDEKRREYLVGAFLERKAGETYFFAHRSFAEFLVAQSLALEPPTASMHGKYDPLVRDGVLEFLEEHPGDSGITKWGDTLANASGTLSQEYLFFLAKHAGGAKALAAKITPASPWHNVVLLSGEPQTLEAAFGEAVFKALRQGSPLSNAMLLYGVGALGMYSGLTTDGRGQQGSPLLTAMPMIVAALIRNALAGVREDAPMARLTVEAGDPERHARLAQAGVSLQIAQGDRTVVFSWATMTAHAEALLQRSGLGLRSRLHGPASEPPLEPVRLRLETMLALLDGRSRTFFRELAKRETLLSAISAVQPARQKRLK